MLIEVLRDSVQIHPKGIKFQQEQINCRISRRLKWKQVKIPSFFISLIIRINKATKSLFRTFKSQSISYQFILWLKNTNQSDEGKRITSLYLTWIAQATFWVWETLWTLHHFLHTFSDFHLKYLEVEDQQKHQLEIKLKRQWTLPFHLLRNSTRGNSGPGTDSIPEKPERIPAWAGKPEVSIILLAERNRNQINPRRTCSKIFSM